MTIVRELVLTTVAIVDLRPTQITVGMREAEAKRKHWRETAKKTKKKAGEFLSKHLIPVVLGPKDRHYIIDHHHLARALHDEGVEAVAVTVISNLRALDRDAFWAVMDNRSWMHPYDDQGRRQHHAHIPKSVVEMVDDPFRSLAGELRRQGGFRQGHTLFSEFLWADFCAGGSSANWSKAISMARWSGRCIGESGGGRRFAPLVRSSPGKP